MKKRIIGIDVARALAVIGMIIVNFKIVFGGKGNETIKFLLGLLEGKAAATFVVLAGVGIAFMSNSAIKNHDLQKIKKTRKRILKRAIFLFIIGLLYIPIWPADILHFYGIYMLITLLLLTGSNKIIVTSSLVLVFIYPLLLSIWNYDTGWNFDTFEYVDFWSPEGFARNLFFNGFHPVIPWSAFMLIGLWFGKQDLSNPKFIKRATWVSVAIFLTITLLSQSLISILAEGNQTFEDELKQILGTSPMPPLPIYMISGSSFAIFIISICIIISNTFETNYLINVLKKTGQLALTFYVAHVIIGMGIVEAVNPTKMGQYSIDFSFIYALIFSVFCMVFAAIWTKFKNIGPLESIMRKLTD